MGAIGARAHGCSRIEVLQHDTKELLGICAYAWCIVHEAAILEDVRFTW